MRSYLLYIFLVLATFMSRAELLSDFDPTLPPDPASAYTLTLSATHAEGATISGAGTYSRGQQVTIQCLPEEGYKFVAWTQNGHVFSNQQTYTFSMPEEDMALVAQLNKLSKYSLLVTANIPEAAECTGQGEYYPGTTVAVSFTTNNDYTFLYWQLNGEVYSYESSFYYTTGASSQQLVAVFEHTPHATITIDVEDPKTGYVSSTGGTYPVDESIAFSATAKTNYIFSHWTLNGNFFSNSPEIIYTVRDYDDQFVAHFEYDPIYPDEPFIELTTTIYLESAPHGAASFNIASGIKHREGDTLFIKTQLNSGYIFEGWYVNNVRIANAKDFVYVVGKKDATLTLRAIPIIYSQLTLMSSPAGAVTFNVSEQAIYEAGTALTLKAAVEMGYLFDGWYLGDSLLTTNVDLQFTMPDHATILVARATYIPSEDEEEDEWDPLPPGEPEMETAYISVKPNNAIMGKTLGTASYVIGDTIILQAIPYHGYLFQQWSDGSTDPMRTIIVSHDLELVAQFTPQIFQVTLLCNDYEMGSVSGEGSYPYRSNATIIASPAEGYIFTKWSDENKEQVHNIYVTSDTTITAFFSPLMYQITVLSSDNLSGSVTGSGWYKNGETAILTAVPEPNNQFIMWSDEVVDNPRTVIVSEDKTYIALFTPTQTAVDNITITHQQYYDILGNPISTTDNLPTGVYILRTKDTTTKVFIP